MASRPRRAAAQRANKTITDMVDSDNHISSRTGRIMSSRASRRSEGKSGAASASGGRPSSPSGSNHHVHFTVKLPASKLRQATSSQPTPSARQAGRESFSGGEIIEGKRNRSQKKSYVVETSDDDDEEEEEEEEDDEDAEGEDDDMMDDDEEDAEGEIVVDDTMDIDAEGEDDDEGDEDAEGEDDDMDMSTIPPPAPVIKVSKPSNKKSGTGKTRGATKTATSKAAASRTKDSDDEELSDLESDGDEIQDTVQVGGGDGDEEDAEGEDEEMEEAGPAEEDDLGSDDDGSRAETPDLTKMTKRQRARFEENSDSLMKLSDGKPHEVQAKKHFTAEELSMRRAEMARRRRNLSEKRNEEVKAPKTNRKTLAGMESTPDADSQRANPIFVRWVSNRNGMCVAVPDEMLAGPAGRVFVEN
ncbi:PAPA-1-like conserved region-domain-containing protein [Nemania sp. FL0916]|nr:PAPA-1-like conserved region-domain-containing protein [Nemania sp. FL0916]